MTKDYLNWMPVKAEINNAAVRPRYNSGDVVWVSIGENVGFEQDGKGRRFARPVLIVKGFNKELFWGVPLTSNANKTGKYYASFSVKGKTSVAILSQLRAFDTSRVSGKRIGVVGSKILQDIQRKLADLLQK
jgi:mRNA interferase MazF